MDNNSYCKSGYHCSTEQHNNVCYDNYEYQANDNNNNHYMYMCAMVTADDGHNNDGNKIYGNN